MPITFNEKDIRAIATSRYNRTHTRHYIGVLTAVVFSLGLIWTLYLSGNVPQYFFSIPLVVLIVGLFFLWRGIEKAKKTLVEEWKDSQKEEER